MRHLIKKQELLLRIAPGLEPFGVQHAASSFYRDKLLSVLERVFDELSKEEEVIMIDRLVIDIGRIAEKTLRGNGSDAELYTVIRKQLLSVMKGERPEAGLSRAALRENVLSQWWYYMEKGRLPWNVTEIDREWYPRVLEILSVDYGSVTRLRQALESKPVFLQRVSYQHPDEFLETLTGILTGARQPMLAKRVEDICFITQWLERIFYEMTAVIGGQPGSAEQRAAAIRALLRWKETHVAFLALPRAGRKAAVWRILLREAARSPGKTKAGGAEDLLFRRFLLQEEGVIHRLLRESGLDLPALWFDGKHAAPESRVTGRRGDRKEKNDAPTGDEKGGRAGSRADDEASGRVDQFTGRVDQTIGRVNSESRQADVAEKEREIGKAAGGGVNDPLAGIMEEGGVYGRHAGLVLLHPFLSTYFTRCGLWENGGFVSPEARQQAVFLLHFLATGEKEGPEYDLLFPKLLCGYGWEDPLPGRMEIPDTAFAEGDGLLQNVLLQWDKLKSTSASALREGFLQRTGKLIRRNDKLLLMLEISGIDILLEFLPWGLSIVKLPWLKDIIYVEWR